MLQLWQAQSVDAGSPAILRRWTDPGAEPPQAHQKSEVKQTMTPTLKREAQQETWPLVSTCQQQKSLPRWLLGPWNRA